MKLNEDEKIVYEYLKSTGFQVIKHEPDGKVPPDFLIDNNIAVEVRRLNENFFSGDKKIGHSEDYLRLWEILRKFAQTYNNKKLSSSYWLRFSYERPIPSSADLKKHLKKQMDEYLNNPIPNSEIEITPTFFISLYPKQSEGEHEIIISSSHDDNSGGAVNQKYITNINYCIAEKSQKISTIKHLYSNWWLVLVDRLIYRTLSNATEHVSSNVLLTKEWDKLILLNPEKIEPTFIINT